MQGFPEDILYNFMREMNDWEKRCLDRDNQCIAGIGDFKQAAEVGMAEYRGIFDRYCSRHGAQPRDQFHYGSPPDYDPDGEVVLDISHLTSDRVRIRTQQNYAFKEKNVYTLVCESGEWRLLEKKIESVAEKGKLLDTDL